MTLRYYARRMWIEEMFGDLKRHGFDLESTMLRHFLRLSRLTLAVVLLYVWMLSVGTQTVRGGLRHLVDRKERRDLSIFQIGLRFIERCLTYTCFVYPSGSEKCPVINIRLLCLEPPMILSIYQVHFPFCLYH
jgi:hypothetical protein